MNPTGANLITSPQHLVRTYLANGPRPRRFLDASLVHGHAIPSKTVWNALSTMAHRGDVLVRPLDRVGSDGEPTNLYSLSPALPSEIEPIADALARQDELLSTALLGTYGESYAYGLFYRTRLFKMPRRNSLGFFQIPGTNDRADLILDLRVPRPPLRRVVIEVKNEYEPLFPSSDAFLRLIDSAVRLDALPVLIGAHITRSALALCSRYGIMALHLGRQIVPKTHPRFGRSKPLVNQLRPLVLGPAPYEYVARRFCQGGLPYEIWCDLEMIADPSWLYDAGVVWFSHVEMIADCLRLEDWPSIRAAIEVRLKASAAAKLVA